MTLLLGPATSVVKAACAIDMGATQVVDMPCDPHEAAHPMHHEREAEGPRCEESQESLHICCQPGNATPSAVVLSNAPQRLAGAVATAVLPGNTDVPDVVEAVHPARSTAPSPPASPVLRQALLATFLI